MLSMSAFWLPAVSACWLLAGQDARPRALEAMEQARQGSPACRITWSTEYHNSRPGSPVRYRGTLARNGDQLFELLGDETGATNWDPEGKPISHAPHVLLHNQDGLWSRRGEDHVVCRTNGLRGFQRDLFRTSYPEFWDFGSIAALGLSEWVVLPVNTSVVWEPDSDEREAISWSEEYDAASKLYRVTKSYESGRFVTWFINPEKGWNPERILTKPSAAAKSSIEVVTTLEKFGDTWFPRIVVRYFNGVPDYTTIVESAEFDPADAPDSLPVSILKLPVGAEVDSYDGKSMVSNQYWDGERALPRDQFDAAVRSGRIKIAQEMREGAARGFVDSKWLTDEERAERRAKVAEIRRKELYSAHETGWERYVRSFIARYKLNEEQSQRAWQIHNDCRDRAREYIDRHKAEFEKADFQLQAASKSGKVEQIGAATEKARELLKPVLQIFQDRLKPRLETLPTRAQREAAEKPPASQPAGPRVSSPS